MKIGIYGDSFAESLGKSSEVFAWYNLLPEYIKGAKVKTYGVGATSVYYSYTQFLKTYKKFDYVIFLVTEPNRYPVKLYDICEMDLYIHNMSQVEEFLKNDPPKKDSKTLEHLMGWFIMNDDNYSEMMNELMIKDILNRKPETLCFPCFPTAFTRGRYIESELYEKQSMIGIVHKQLTQLGMRPGLLPKYDELDHAITCHLGEEYNHAVAKLFATKIQTGVWDWDSLNNTTLKNKKNFYYRKK